jgi:hypothetical protein
MEKIFAIILDVMLCLFSVLFLFFSILASKNYILDTSLLREYKLNWFKGPIIEIIKINENQNDCPVGYDPFIRNNFPGNIEGCDCSTSKENKYKKKIYKKQCDSNRIADGCTMIFKRQEKSLLIWKGSKLCVKRMKENFWELEVTSGDCPIGKKKCGVIDNFKNTLCIDLNDKCPINQIVIRPSNEEQLKDYNMIQLNEKFNLFFTNSQTDESIITEIEARTHPICAHPFEGKLGQNFYPLNLKQGPPECKTKISEYLTDYRFQELDTQEIFNFYNQNGVMKIISKFPDFSYPKPLDKDLVTLYKINYFGFNKNCLRNRINQSDLANVEQAKIKYYADIAHLLKVLCIFKFTFVVLSIVIYKVVLEKLSVTLQIVFFIDSINLIIIGSSLIISCIILSATNNILNSYSSFVNGRCGDKITNEVIDFAFEGLSRVPGFLIFINVLAIIEICYIFGFYIWVFFFS